MENLSEITEEKGLELTKLSIKYIEESAKWGKFIAIIGFVGVAFMLLLAIGVGIILPGMNLSELQDMQGMGANPSAAFLNNGFGPFMAVLYVLFAVLYFIPILFLFNYSRQSINAIKQNDSDLLTSAFNNMRRQYKFVGILTIILIALYALIFLGAFIGGVLSAFV